MCVALQCAFFVKKGALLSAQSALDDYFCTIEGDERRGWSWSLIVEAVENELAGDAFTITASPHDA